MGTDSIAPIPSALIFGADLTFFGPYVEAAGRQRD